MVFETLETGDGIVGVGHFLKKNMDSSHSGYSGNVAHMLAQMRAGGILTFLAEILENLLPPCVLGTQMLLPHQLSAMGAFLDKVRGLQAEVNHLGPIINSLHQT